MRSESATLDPGVAPGLELSAESADLARRYGRLLRGRMALLALLAVAALAAFCLDLATGPSGVTLGAVLHELLRPSGADTPLGLIVWEVRLPQAVAAVLIGGALSVAGVELQTALDNPLASPLTLGAAPAAAFGASLAIVLGIGAGSAWRDWALPGYAFVFAFSSVLLIWAAARLGGGSTSRIVLLGIGLSYAFQALTWILQYVATTAALQQIVFWIMGSLSQVTGAQARILLLAIAALVPFAMRSAWCLTVLQLGDEQARSFGVDTTRLRLWALVRASLLTATAMSFAGMIGFVGLVAPHIARLLVGRDARFLLPGATLVGSAMLSFASVASKLAIPGAVLPIGVVTAVIGLPVFFALVFGRRAAE